MVRRILRVIARWPKSVSRRSSYAFLERHLVEVPSGAVVLSVGSGGGYDDLIRESAAVRGFTVQSSDIDVDRNPDIVDDICASSLASESIDLIVIADVLEHVQQPHEAAREIDRILKAGGAALIAVPFIFPIHARPHDYFRYTEYGLRYLFSHMEVAELRPRDNWLEALLLAGGRISLEPGRLRLSAILFVSICALLYPLASLARLRPTFITSGYTMKVVKRAGTVPLSQAAGQG
jgi:SAM-dependent methyltransferase